jgi:methane/ammonia monooxygenase subunit A
MRHEGGFEGFGALDRKFDILFVVAALFLVIAGMQVTLILWGGDWDFWVDWKDRQWWPPIGSASNLVVPALLQYITWTLLRLPLGATFGAVAIALATWLSRVVNMYGWAYFPVPFVWPATFIPQALLLDFILMWTRSFLLTSILGGLLWGGLFYSTQWVQLAPFLQPVEYHGQIMTVADVMGFEYVRTQTPEYYRFVERGALRAFVEEITVVVAFFSGFVCVLTYWFGHLVGRYAVWPAKVFLKRM